MFMLPRLEQAFVYRLQMLQPLQAQVVSASTGSGCFSLYRLKLFPPLQAQVASASAGSSYISLCRLKLLQAFVQEESCAGSSCVGLCMLKWVFALQPATMAL